MSVEVAKWQYYGDGEGQEEAAAEGHPELVFTVKYHI
jgi:hypothetical protein